MAFSLGTGSVPGWPRQTGHTFVLGGAPNAFGQPQNILVAVDSSTWHSRPMTASYSVRVVVAPIGLTPPSRAAGSGAARGPARARTRPGGRWPRRGAGP